MLPIFARQASTKIKEASKKTSYLVACLFVLASFLFASSARAYDPKNIDMNRAYQQIFGEQFNQKSQPKRKIAKKVIAIKDVDLVSAYHQLFPQKKKPTATIKLGDTASNKNKKAKRKVALVKKKAAKTISIPQKPVKQASVIKSQPIKNITAKTTKPEVAQNIEESVPSTSSTSSLDALFAKAFGKQSSTLAPSKVTVELRINKTVLGDVTVFSNKKGRIDRVEKEAFLVLLKDVVKEHVYKKVIKQASKKEKILFNALATEGISAEYNSVDLSLDLSMPTILRKPLRLSMRPSRDVSVRDENKVKPEKYSGFLNAYSNLVMADGASKPLLNMRFEGSFSVGNTVLEGNVSVINEKFSSDRLRLTYDKPEKLQRFMLGDLSTGSRNFQENIRLNGFRVSKEFYMNPDLQIRPQASESFELKSDSEVEVLINNQLRQRFFLRAGIYSLEDIGLYDGVNNIRIKIKDEFGKITEKTSRQFYESNLLKKDLSVYAFSVGYLSNKQIGATNNLIKDPILSGYYQKGITEDLTLGVDAQISANAYLLGSEIINSASLGILKSSIAFSGGSNKSTGMATRFEFKPNSTDKKHLLFPQNDIFKSWTLSGEYRSKNFSLLNSSDSIDVVTGASKKQLRGRLQTNVGLQFNDDWRGSLNLSLNDYHDAKINSAVNLIATRRFLNSYNLSIGARYNSDDKFSMNLQLSIPLSNVSKKKKLNLDFRADSKTNTFDSKLSMLPHSNIGRYSLAGSLEYIQNDTSKQQNVDVQYRGANYETNFKARNNISQNGLNSLQLNVGLNTSLACIGKACAITHPIYDSFALVSGPSNQTTPIAINNGSNRFIYSDENTSGLPDNYTAVIAGKNKKAVVKLDSYRYQSINIAESTLPNGYDTEKTEFEVFPRYHQGFLIKAGGEPATILNGILVNAENKPLSFKGGQWIPENTEAKTIAFFSNKAGRFRVTSIPAGKYRLELFDLPDMQTVYINVPDLKGEVHDLGTLQIIE